MDRQGTCSFSAYKLFFSEPYNLVGQSVIAKGAPRSASAIARSLLIERPYDRVLHY
jgi:hypothetical protein